MGSDEKSSEPIFMETPMFNFINWDEYRKSWYKPMNLANQINASNWISTKTKAQNMNIDSTVIEDIEPGDIVLYKDYTEAPWSIGILHHIDKKAEPKHRYYVITQIKYDENKLDVTLDSLVQIYPYRYVSKLIVNK